VVKVTACFCRLSTDEDEFFADHGIRSLSKYHKDHPYSMDVNGQKYEVAYLPGDSDSGLFGGNSNWRGPIWLAVNFLLIESCQRFHLYYGNNLKVECPTGSGDYMHLGHVAEEIQHRLQHLFARGDDGRRAINDGNQMLDFDPNWKDYMWYHEFFDGDTGRGLGATHQCGWTGLIAKMIHDTGMTCRLPQTPRTPTGAADHYFDDVFSSTGRPARRQTLRRSSTNRSIGFRSDWETSNNDDEDEATSTIRRKNSVGVLDHEAMEQKAAMEDRLNHYVTGQLQRIKTGMQDYEPDEFETMTDGASESKSKYGRNGRGRDGGDYFEQDEYFSK
jgi:hypothetical protein